MQGLSMARVWEHFSARNVPETAPPGQREDMQTSFYAGALAVLSFVESLSDAPDEMVAVYLLHEVHTEIYAFADARKAGINLNGATHNDQE